MSKRIEALGGQYGVCNRSDGAQGSMFWFTFPYRPDEAAARAESSDGTPGTAHLSRNTSDLVPPRKILVIDDSLSVLKVTSRLLTMNGHTVVTAPNGAVGLEMLKEAYANQLFDMVLTDLQMPVMDGIEATKRFRSFENDEIDNNKMKYKKMLIVGMSANSDNKSKQEALESGMDFFVTKPFSYKDLMTILITCSV